MAEVPILWKQSSEPFVCGVVFRVGRADERVVTTGITHLIEHLSLPTRWPPEVDFNASVGPRYTDFWFAGPQKAALAMLSRLMRDLVDPPLERLARERSILRAEASWRGWGGVAAHALNLRFGLAGPGLATLPEYGLEWLGRAELREWIARAFCAANARAYMTARPPHGFALELPRGRRLPTPVVEPLESVRLPAVYMDASDGAAGISLLVERTYAATTLARIAERRVRGLLRYRLGVSYGGSYSYGPIDDRRAHLFLSADAQPRNVDAVRSGLLVVLDELAERGPTEQELARERQVAARDARNPHSLLQRLTANACSELDGRGRTSREEMVAGMSATTSDDVRTTAAQALETALLMLPARATVPGGRFTRYPLHTSIAIKGRRLAPAADADVEGAEGLLVGSKGVTLDWGGGRFWTVRFADCVGRIRWGNGVELLDRDGTRIWVDATKWENAEAAVKKIEAARIRPESTVDVRRPPPRFDDPDLVAGELAYREERWEDAVRLLELGLTRSPNEPDAWSRLAYALKQLGAASRAVAAAARASELDAADDWAPNFASSELEDMERAADAARMSAEAVQRNPTSLDNLSQAVSVFVDDERVEDAEKLAARAVELFPEEDVAWFCAGWAAQARGDLAAGLAGLRRAVELDPQYSMWRNNLALALIKTGALDEALSELDAAAELDAENEFVTPNRIVALRLLGRAEEARALTAEYREHRAARARERSERFPDDAYALAQLAEALAAARDGGARAEAMELIERAIQIDPHPANLVIRARLQLGLGETQAARRSLAAAARIDPNDTAVLLERALLAALTGAATDAEQAAARLAELRPRSVAAELARTCESVAAERWQEALRSARRVLLIDPLDCCGHAAAGIAAAKLGRTRDARRALADADARAVDECLTASHLEALLDAGGRSTRAAPRGLGAAG